MAASTIKAVGLEAYGPADNLKDVTIPAPAAPTGFDILVEVKAVGLNPGEAMRGPA